ncbi:MAG: EAL domain-containing protein [Gammaproteobacteria bacterium]|nr:EAL domain-containing protein [Gammaproteobacteria bacterium]
MKLIATIKHSIGLMQAIMLLVSSLVIGLALSAVQIYLLYEQQQQEIETNHAILINLSKGGATNAAWSLDSRLANEVLLGIIEQPGIEAAEIRASLRNDEFQILGQQQQQMPTYDWLSEWVAAEYFEQSAQISQTLTIRNQQQVQDAGSLVIRFDPRYEARKFVITAATALLISLLEASLIGLVLFFLVQWFITSPISRAATSIANVDTDDLHGDDQEPIPLPGMHQHDELGQLITHTNQLLDRLKISHSRLKHLATKDPLTGLANRILIKDFLANMIANAQRSSSMVAVIFIDLDRFKYVNDTLGHNMGDKLLKYVSITLLRQIRDQDAVGRLGGDEFLLLMPTKAVTDVINLAERVLQVLTKTITIDGYDLQVNASLGIALYPNDGEDADTLMRCADLAMYKAKEHKSSQWHLFSEEMKLKVEESLALETALAGAIKHNELELYLQPQFAVGGMRLAACEALLRWQNNGEYIDTQKFIEVAELTGLIGDIGQWVLEEACRIIKHWGEQAVPISVNVSGQQLADEGFVEDVIATVKNAAIDPRMIEFEITETMLMQNLEQSHQRLTELREQGFRISIDDFGTGYSSLSYLTQLPIDALKIDRSFVSGSQQSAIVLETIIALGKALGIHVVAEGVETEQQKGALIESGCDVLQGYLLGRPLPLAKFETDFLAQQEQTVQDIKKASL